MLRSDSLYGRIDSGKTWLPDDGLNDRQNEAPWMWHADEIRADKIAYHAIFIISEIV